MRSIVTRCALVLPAALAGCAQYRSAPLDVEKPIRASSTPLPSSWTYEAAVRYAVEHNPDLIALAARANAVNLDPAREPLELGAGVDSDHRGEFSASLDALSLLGLGTRPYDVALACARRNEALLAHHARAREIAGEIGEAFVVDRALHSLQSLIDPEAKVDVSAFVRAGLESASAETAAAATVAVVDAERAAREAELRANRLALVRLLGLHESAPFQLVSPAPDWPVPTSPTPAQLIVARADVQRRVAAFETADRQIRRAVKAQYPSLAIEPGIAMDPTSLFGAVRLKFPVGMSSEVRALEAEREATRAEFESSVLDAVRDAAVARVAWTATGSALVASGKRVESTLALLKGARVRLEVASGSPIEMVFSADAVIDAAVAHRGALLDEARARVKAARAAGWPGATP